MKPPLRFVAVAAACGLSACVTVQSGQVQYLEFSVSDSSALGQIEELHITVNCSWISVLDNVPELYDIEMEYDMPTQHILDARPRLGAAAVELSEWSGVVGIRIPADADGKSCFAVKAEAEGRNGIGRQWTGEQLGLHK